MGGARRYGETFLLFIAVFIAPSVSFPLCLSVFPASWHRLCGLINKTDWLEIDYRWLTEKKLSVWQIILLQRDAQTDRDTVRSLIVLHAGRNAFKWAVGAAILDFEVVVGWNFFVVVSKSEIWLKGAFRLKFPNRKFDFPLQMKHTIIILTVIL